jgi:hypothetical protein
MGGEEMPNLNFDFSALAGLVANATVAPSLNEVPGSSLAGELKIRR